MASIELRSIVTTTVLYDALLCGPVVSVSATDPGCNQDTGWPSSNGANLCERFFIDKAYILRLDSRFAFKNLPNKTDQLCTISFTIAVRGHSALKPSVQRQSLLACDGPKAHIARTHCQTIALSQRWPSHDLDCILQIGNHLFNGSKLLKIFFSKNSLRWLHDIKKHADNRRHTTEVPWSTGTLKRLGNFIDRHPALKTGAIHHFRGGQKHPINASSAQ